MHTICYKYLQDEIPDENLFEIYTAMSKWNFMKKYVWKQQYPNQYQGSLCLTTMKTSRYGKSPNI